MAREILKVPVTDFADVLTSEGRERRFYSAAVSRLNNALIPYIDQIRAVGEETAVVENRHRTEEGVGPAAVLLRVQRKGSDVTLTLDHRVQTRNRSTRFPYWDLCHRTTVIVISEGLIKTIESGEDRWHDNPEWPNSPSYTNTGELISRKPLIKTVEGGIKGYTEAIDKFTRSLLAAQNDTGFGMRDL